MLKAPNRKINFLSELAIQFEYIKNNSFRACCAMIRAIDAYIYTECSPIIMYPTVGKIDGTD